jgi:hypothetical protein
VNSKDKRQKQLEIVRTKAINRLMREVSARTALHTRVCLRVSSGENYLVAGD